MAVQRLEVRGAELAVEMIGDGTRLPLVWGHGLTMSRAAENDWGWVDWPSMADSVRVIRYDARGHGESQSTPDRDGYSWAELGRDQLALADALGIDRYICGGASMGCGTALHVATQAPARIDRLVLLIPPTAWETRQAQAGLWDKSAEIIEAKGVEPLIKARSKLPIPTPFQDDVDYRERRDADTRAWEPTRLAQVFRGATVADFPSREVIATIACPTLLLAWIDDPVHPVATAEELQSLIPGSELVVASTRSDIDAWTDRISDFAT